MLTFGWFEIVFDSSVVVELACLLASVVASPVLR